MKSTKSIFSLSGWMWFYMWYINADGYIHTWKKISCVFFGICLTPESPSSPDTHTQGLTVAIAMLSFFMGIIATRYGIPGERQDTRAIFLLSNFTCITLKLSSSLNKTWVDKVNRVNIIFQWHRSNVYPINCRKFGLEMGRETQPKVNFQRPWKP